MKLNLVIPMAGKGKRFRKAGYQTFKPFVPIQGKPMVAHVTDVFPAEVRKFVLIPRALLNDEQAHYLQKELRCEIIDIPDHDDGPAYSIYLAREKLPLEESFFISYCDIFWQWDFAKIVKNLNHAGVIYTHQDFHPHLIQNNFSAFCLPDPKDPNRLQVIQEKGSFTKQWMNEPLSVGVFYVQQGREMIAAIEKMIQKNLRVAGEYFPSLLFNDLVARGQRVHLERLDFYIHWGVPEQLQDFERWQKVFTADGFRGSGAQPHNVMVMGGLGERMKTVSAEPKAMIPIETKPMFQFVLDRFPSSQTTLITTPSVAETLKGWKGGELLVLPRQTASQFETIVSAVDTLKNRRDFFLTSCDAYGIFDFDVFRKFTREKNPDAVIFTFRPSLTQEKLGGHHTHVSVSGDKVTAVHIKSKQDSDDLGLAGFFWIRDGRIFDALREMPASTGERYADHLFKFWVEQGLNVARFDVDPYVHLGTPEEFLEYRYWSERKFLFKR